MSDLIVLSSRELIDDFGPDENPADTFPCLPCGPLVRDERATLYALTARILFDEAVEQEVLVRALFELGPYVYQLNETSVAAIASLDEDDVDGIAANWFSSAGVADLGFDEIELAQFLFQYIHFCRTAQDDLGIFIFSDN